MTTDTMKIPQAMEPRGYAGRVFSMLMERLNASTYRRAVALLEPTPEQSFLEIGFGTGKLIEMMATHLKDGCVAGVDPSRLMVETTRRRLKNTSIHHDIRQGTAETLPWRDATFDSAAALHSFQFWPDPVRALAEIHRCLKRGGKFVLILRNHENARNRDWLPNPWSRQAGETEEAAKLLIRAGFTVRHIPRNAGQSAILFAEKR